MVASLHTRKYELFRGLLANARKGSGVTQVELAKKLNCPQSFISKYENGERRIDVSEFVEIAHALDINPNDFLLEYLKKCSHL
jgi:transcriptional regulator with XRE-family HTH domain